MLRYGLGAIIAVIGVAGMTTATGAAMYLGGLIALVGGALLVIISLTAKDGTF